MMRSLLLLSSTVLAGCTAAAPARVAVLESAAVYQSLGSRQCEGGGRSLSALAVSLEQAGVTVFDRACGTDGRMRAAVCGGPDGWLAVFDIAPAGVDAARALGFAPLSDLPGAHRAPCPPHAVP